MMTMLDTKLVQAEVDSARVRTLHTKFVVVDSTHAQAIVTHMLRFILPVGSAHGLGTESAAQLLVVHFRLDTCSCQSAFELFF